MIQMGLFDFFKKKTDKKAEEHSHADTSLTANNRVVAAVRPGIVSTTRIALDVSTHEQLKKQFISFDVETTGLSASSDRIIELGAVRFENGVPVDTFSTLVNPGIVIPPSATAVNHISNEMIKSAPSEGDVYKKLIDFLGDATHGEMIMCAHNARFDFEFLEKTLCRLGIDAEIKYVDTLSLARHFIPGLHNYKQCTIESHFGLSNSNSHRAASDAEMCGNILNNILLLATDEMEEERKQIESSSPSQEELEVCAFLLNDLMKRGADTSWIRFRKNSGNYVDITCLYTYLKFKFAKKGKYIIVAESETRNISLPVEACTASEGGTDVRRVYFSKPQDLSPFLDYFYKAYASCYKSMHEYISSGNYARREAEECIRTMKALSAEEIANLMASLESREYTDNLPCVKTEPTITRADVVVNAQNNRCPLCEIKNLHNWDRGFEAGFKYWEQGEVARKEGDLTKAISLYDIARYNGYEAPALYESYAMAYRQMKDYDNEIVILEEFLSRNTYGKAGVFEARRDKAISLLYKQQQAAKNAEEKILRKEQARKEKASKATAIAEPKQSRGKAIVQLTDDGTVIQEFETVTAASNAIGVSTKSIRDAAQGVQKHAGGYCWKYKK